MDPDDLYDFAVATAKLKADPAQLHKPELASFRDFLLSWPGVRLPAKPAAAIDGGSLSSDDEMAVVKNGVGASPATGAADTVMMTDVVPESDDEDGERMPPESSPPPPMPPCGNLEPSEAELEACNVAKKLATKALDAGDVQGALDRMTEAVVSGGASALLFARRAEILLQLRRPKASILDCSAALEVNPECGKAFRIRGIAHRRLGHWDSANQDLTQGQKLDYDDSIVEVLKHVAEKLKQKEVRSRLAARQAFGKPQGKRAKVA